MNTSKNAMLIRFGDNDFYYTWTAVLESATQSRDIFKLKDKKKLAFILSQAAWGMYCLHQNQCEYNGLDDYSEEYITHMKEYLTLSEDRIKLDDEVGEHLSSVGYNDSSTFYVYEYEGIVRHI